MFDLYKNFIKHSKNIQIYTNYKKIQWFKSSNMFIIKTFILRLKKYLKYKIYSIFNNGKNYLIFSPRCSLLYPNFSQLSYI